MDPVLQEIMHPSLGAAVGTAIGAGLMLIATVARDKLGREGRSYDQLVTQVTERLASQEARLLQIEAALDHERSKRHLAENEVHALQLRVARLETELRLHGIEVPE